MFRVEEGRRFYLLVTASSNAADWVLPKGTIKKDETPEEAALREVREEAGVRAESLGAVEQVPGSGNKLIQYFLMRYLWDVEQMEQRGRDYWSYEDALSVVSRPDVLAALESAEERARQLDTANAVSTEFSNALGQQLELLSTRLRDTERLAHAFLALFGFGGLITMLVMAHAHAPLGPVPLFALGVLGTGYALLVAARFGVFRRRLLVHRYRYELTLRARFGDGRSEAYARWLAAPLDKPGAGEDDGEESAFDSAARALLAEHRERWRAEVGDVFRAGRWPFAILTTLWVLALGLHVV